MSVTETVLRLKAWKSLEMNSTVRFLNFKLMQMAMQSKLSTDHHSKKHRSRQKNSKKMKTRLVYDEDVVKMLNLVLISYQPHTIEHQPNIYTAKQRVIEIVASKKISLKLSINTLHTLHYGLNVMKSSQKDAFKTMLDKSIKLLIHSKQLEARLHSLREFAKNLELHAPSVRTT